MKNPVLYVGIDVSNAKLDVAFLGADERPLRRPDVYANDPDGWTALEKAIIETASSIGPAARVVCGMESTANMHKRLAQRLRRVQGLEIEVHVLNPFAVKHFGKAMLKDSKTDRIDSHLIAQFVLRMKQVPTRAPSELIEELRSGTRTRRSLVEERTRQLNRLHGQLRYYLPGYKKALEIKEIPKRLLVLLVAMPSPHEILCRSLQDLATIRYGKSNRRVGVVFAEKLLTLAARAPSLELPILTRTLIRTTAQRILDLDDLLLEIEREIAKLIDVVFPDQLLTTIPGVGKVTAASVLAEVGDLSRFKNKKAFIGYCGLYPIVWESGDAKRRYRMTRKGNRMLKMCLLLASGSARQYNPAIAAFYARLKARGKTKRAAGGAAARKLAEIVFAVLVSGEPWSAEKATASIQKAEAMAEVAA